MAVRHFGEVSLSHSFGKIKRAIAAVPRPYYIRATMTGTNPHTGLINTAENGLGSKTVAVLKAEIDDALLRGDTLVLTVDLGSGLVFVPINSENATELAFEATGRMGGGEAKVRIVVKKNNLAIDSIHIMPLQEVLSFDNAPTYGSESAVTSGGVYAALDSVLGEAKSYADGVALGGADTGEFVRRYFLEAWIVNAAPLEVAIPTLENDLGWASQADMLAELLDAWNDGREIAMWLLGDDRNYLLPMVSDGYNEDEELLGFRVDTGGVSADIAVSLADLHCETTERQAQTQAPAPVGSSGARGLYVIDATITGVAPSISVAVNTAENGLGDKTTTALAAEIADAIARGDMVFVSAVDANDANVFARALLESGDGVFYGFHIFVGTVVYLGAIVANTLTVFLTTM